MGSVKIVEVVGVVGSRNRGSITVVWVKKVVLEQHCECELFSRTM